MNGEINDLSTDNVKTTFTSTPNNTELSDELTADPIYTRKMGTAYSISKRTKVTLIAVSTTLIVAGGALSIANNFNFANPFVGSVPSINNLIINSSEEADAMTYSFAIENKGSLKVTFTVSIDYQVISSIDCSATNNYEGTIDNLGFDKKVKYEVYYTNSIDFRKSLAIGSFVTISK